MNCDYKYRYVGKFQFIVSPHDLNFLEVETLLFPAKFPIWEISKEKFEKNKINKLHLNWVYLVSAY